jgi:hypothetical protein
MDEADDGLNIPENAEFSLDNLELEHADVVETDDDGLAWLAQTELPSNIEGIDYSVGVPADGEAMA